MNMHDVTSAPESAGLLSDLIARQQPGWSLAQPFYLSPEIYEIERKGWLADQWYLIGHASELPTPKSVIVRELLGEPILIVRDEDGTLRGFYNVCRHRGSRLCSEDGRVSNLLCPYHAWTYRFDGALRSAPSMPDTMDRSAFHLHRINVAEIGGLVLASLNGSLDAVDKARVQGENLLAYHGVPNARIAYRKSYPTHANWKLVMENFFECYHCLPSHPEFSSVMNFVSVIGKVPSAAAAEKWEKEVAEWSEGRANRECPMPDFGSDFNKVADSNTYRLPIGNGHLTASRDGQPVAPLMGGQKAFDGGMSGFRMEPFVNVVAYNDHVRLIHFLPKGPEETDVSITWLVDADAAPDDIDIDRMIWLWDVTTVQDKKIIEENAAGVRSRAYASGPYSPLESLASGFVQTYLDGLRGNL